MAKYSPRTVVFTETAATSGHLLKWLYECDVHHGTAVFGQQEMYLAVMHGHLDVLLWLHDKCRVSPALQCIVSPASLFSIERRFCFLQAAADNGHLEVVRWLAEELNRVIRSLHGDGGLPAPHSLLLTKVAMSGHFHVLEYLHGQEFAWLELALTPKTGNAAAENGHFDLVKWLLDHDMLDASSQRKCMAVAAARGDLHWIQWLQATRPIPFDIRVVCETTRNGHLHILQYLHENASDGTIFTVDAMNQAAKCGHLQLVQWLHFNRTEGCTASAMNKAASNGHLEVVKWLHANRTEGCTYLAMTRAAMDGHLDVVQWLHANRTEGCTEYTLRHAASRGHLNVVKWLHENRTEEFATDSLHATAIHGYLDVVKWLHANRPESSVGTMDLAATNGHLDVVKWLHRNCTDSCTTSAVGCAAAQGRLDIVKWLHYNRTEGRLASAMNYAARGGHFDVMVFLHENRSKGCTFKAFENAVMTSDLDMLRWLAAHYPQHFDPSTLLHLSTTHRRASLRPAIAAWLTTVCNKDGAVDL